MVFSSATSLQPLPPSLGPHSHHGPRGLSKSHTSQGSWGFRPGSEPAVRGPGVLRLLLGFPGLSPTPALVSRPLLPAHQPLPCACRCSSVFSAPEAWPPSSRPLKSHPHSAEAQPPGSAPSRAAARTFSPLSSARQGKGSSCPGFDASAGRAGRGSGAHLLQVGAWGSGSHPSWARDVRRWQPMAASSGCLPSCRLWARALSPWDPVLASK